MTRSNLERKGYILFYPSGNHPLQRGVRTGIQSRNLEAEADAETGIEGTSLTGLFIIACSSHFLSFFNFLFI